MIGRCLLRLLARVAGALAPAAAGGRAAGPARPGCTERAPPIRGCDCAVLGEKPGCWGACARPALSLHVRSVTQGYIEALHVQAGRGVICPVRQLFDSKAQGCPLITRVVPAMRFWGLLCQHGNHGVWIPAMY